MRLARTTNFTTAESHAVRDYVSNGGNVIALAGYDISTVSLLKQQSVFADFGIVYQANEGIAIGPTETFNPASPLAQGVNYIAFDGGFFSSSYGGPGEVQYVVSNAVVLIAYHLDTAAVIVPNPASGPLGQTIQLPAPGGRMLVWGDEYITYPLSTAAGSAFLNTHTANSNYLPSDAPQFWANAIAWTGQICVPQAQLSPCDSPVEFSTSCAQAAVTTQGTSIAMAFDDSSSVCGTVNK